MLGSTLYRVVKDGAVTGYSVFELPEGTGAGTLCGFCANDMAHLARLDLEETLELGTSTRLVTVSVCLPLCTDCSQKLNNDFKTTRG